MTSKTKHIAAKVGWTPYDQRCAREQCWRLALYDYRANEMDARIERHPHVPDDKSRFLSQKEAEDFVRRQAATGDSTCLKALATIVRLKLKL